MKSEVLMIVHQATSTTGRVGRLLRSRGYTEDIRCPNLGAPLPDDLDRYAGIVMFGGPMSANDDALHPGIRAELDWLDKVLAGETPFFGVCLGAQLMARALGAAVWAHPRAFVEIGFYPISGTDAGKTLFPDSLHAYQWHRESFDLPQGTRLLACSELFENQAFCHGERHFGVQFHPDVTRDVMMRWVNGGGRRLVQPGAQGPEAQRQASLRYDASMEQWCSNFLDAWLE